MGLDYQAVRFLLKAKSDGINFSKFLTVGRQDLLVIPDHLKSLLLEYNYECTTEDIERFFKEENQFAEPLLKFLGAKEIDSIDFSDFEGASIIHDMNKSLPPGLANRFSVVFDGGTLEHVFNFPTAIRNCMELVEPEGHFLSVTPCNNMMGHGFYQFSPELYYRIFTKENGFRVEHMYICRAFSQEKTWFEVSDPAEVRSRVELRNSYPTFLMVSARKLGCTTIFEATPQQSDYQSEWHSKTDKGEGIERLQFFHDQLEEYEKAKRKKSSFIKKMIPKKVKKIIRDYRDFREVRKEPNPDYFKKTD